MAEYRKYLRKNLPVLLEYTQIRETQIILCSAKQIVSKEERDNLLRTSRMTMRSNLFWDIIQTRENVLDTLIWIFHETGQSQIVEILKRAERDDETDTDYKFIKDLRPLTVAVSKPTKKIEHADDAYKLDPDIIGHALIINITEYTSSEYPSRASATKDTEYMTQLFGQLGYLVLQHEGYISNADMEYDIDRLLTKLRKQTSSQSCVVFIGAHGVEDKFIMSDGTHYSIPHILTKFAKENLLDSKPKIFIFNACNLDLNLTNTVDKLNNFQLSDTIICHPKYNPIDHQAPATLIGSWFVHTLTKIIMENALNTEFHEILEKVKKCMQNTVGHISTQNLLFSFKPLYFNVSQ